VENVNVAKRAVRIWENVKTYVAKVGNKTIPNPDTVSYNVVKEHCADPLTIAKLLSFIGIANVVEPFLSFYQTDLPVLPFLGDDMFRLMRALMRRFLKGEVMEMVSKSNIMSVEVTNKENHALQQDVDVGFDAEADVKRLFTNKNSSARQVMEFREQCRLFLMKLVGKLTMKAPLKYPLVRHIACLDPRQMSRERESSVNHFKNVLRIWRVSERIPFGSSCDVILQQYRDFLDTVVAENHGIYSNFKPCFRASCDDESRVDVLLRQDMGGGGAMQKDIGTFGQSSSLFCCCQCHTGRLGLRWDYQLIVRLRWKICRRSPSYHRDSYVITLRLWEGQRMCL
jgi:hypothetical protein